MWSACACAPHGAAIITCSLAARCGSPRVRRPRYRPQMSSGEQVGALAMSEPEDGADVVSMRLRGERRGDQYLLNGSKMSLTNGPDADVLVIFFFFNDTAAAEIYTLSLHDALPI